MVLVAMAVTEGEGQPYDFFPRQNMKSAVDVGTSSASESLGGGEGETHRSVFQSRFLGLFTRIVGAIRARSPSLCHRIRML